MIKVTDLYKEYQLNKKQQKEFNTTETTVVPVNKISFECQPGRIFSLLGPNGAGKTTTLRMISTMIKPSSGSINVCGLDAVEQEGEVRKKIGFLTGSTGLYERLTTDEMIKYFADLNDVPAEKFEERKNYYYDLLDMHDFAKKRTGQLSTGMRQKVSIVRTMIHDPEVVVFDEPTSGLDVISAENIIKLIRNCKEQGKTVIFSSHIMTEVDLLCDDLAIINKGNLVYKGSMDEFRSQMQAETLTAEFIRIVNQA
ncbi:MAG: ATP-binding cassette domain-containing protein [Crocinitomicaceae bacterium]|nr:ATP-binding cassette domain-containing protein [Crocinitomicaceae bacterium]